MANLQKIHEWRAASHEAAAAERALMRALEEHATGRGAAPSERQVIDTKLLRSAATMLFEQALRASQQQPPA